MGLIRALVNTISLILKTFILLMKVLIRFRLIVLIVLVAVSLLVNVSLFTGNFYFERFNSLFATITRITPISYRDREEKRLVEKKLESSRLALEKQYEAIYSLNK